jgi:hypothetical protein
MQPVSEADMIEMEQYARRYGSSNCWTGTSGTLGGYVIILLKEVRTLRAQLVSQSDGVSESGLQRVYQGQGAIQGWERDNC